MNEQELKDYLTKNLSIHIFNWGPTIQIHLVLDGEIISKDSIELQDNSLYDR